MFGATKCFEERLHCFLTHKVFLETEDTPPSGGGQAQELDGTQPAAFSLAAEPLFPPIGLHLLRRFYKGRVARGGGRKSTRCLKRNNPFSSQQPEGAGGRTPLGALVKAPAHTHTKPRTSSLATEERGSAGGTAGGPRTARSADTARGGGGPGPAWAGASCPLPAPAVLPQAPLSG